jgi:LysW-gamma-L-lysine carboxypeptidase
MNEARWLEELVRIPSASGDVDAASSWLAERARDDGFRVHRDSAGNVHMRTAGAGPLVWWVGHLDTVPGDIPVRIEAGELWGRGSVDAKGALAAAFHAARAHLDDARIHIVACPDEESDSRGARALATDLDPTAIIIGEPSGADGFTLGYKGIVRGTLEHSASARHGGHAGPNALDAFVAAWPAGMHEGDGYDELSLHLRRLASSHDGLADHLEATFESRIPPGRSAASVQTAMEHAWPTAAFTWHEALDAVSSAPRSPLANRFRAAIRAAGMTPRPKRKTGTSDWNILAAHYAHVPTIAYGPGDAALDHTPLERLPLADLRAAVAVLSQVFASFGNSTP